MRTKAPLVLMEQLVMLLVFALAATVCVRAFALADEMSRQAEDLDQAVIAAEQLAETLRASGGDYEQAAQWLGGSWDGATLGVQYDQDWQRTQQDARYVALAVPADSGQPLLGTASVWVCAADGTYLWGLTAAWQEAEP